MWIYLHYIKTIKTDRFNIWFTILFSKILQFFKTENKMYYVYFYFFTKIYVLFCLIITWVSNSKDILIVFSYSNMMFVFGKTENSSLHKVTQRLKWILKESSMSSVFQGHRNVTTAQEDKYVLYKYFIVL